MAVVIIPKDHLLLHAIEKAKESQDSDRFHALMRRAFLVGKNRGYGDDVSFDIAKRPLAFGWYVAMRLDGATHRLAEMLALGETPFLMTDSVFLAGEVGMNKTFERSPAMGDYYKGVAESKGCDVTGAIYMPGLADYPGDPRAWVRGRGDIMRVAEEKNLTVDGAVKRSAREDKEPPPDIDVAADLVEERVLDMVEANPDLARGDRGELFHEAKQSLLPKRGKVA